LLNKPIPYGRQDISDADIGAVVDVLRSAWITQGPIVPKFESVVSAACGTHFAAALNSATSALHLSCLSLGVGPGDHVWTTPTTFVASANCARYCGAEVDFVDIDPNTWCMSPIRLRDKLELHRRKKLPLPKVVIPVHLSGQSCDMNAIGELKEEYGFKVIEDASHAIGGSYDGKPVGNCRFSEITVFSFHPVKIVTSGEGGVAVTNDSNLHAKILLNRSHGITRNPSDMHRDPPGEWYYEQIELGFNYRMTDIQAALGISQMGRLDQFVQRRNEIANVYEDRLAQAPVKVQFLPDHVISSRHLFVVRVPAARHKKIFSALREAGIMVNLHYSPVHLQPYYLNLGFGEGDFPEAESYAQEAISLPLYPTLSDAQLNFVIKALMKEILI